MSDGGASTEQLIASARDGDDHALCELFDRFRESLLAQITTEDGVAVGVESTQIVSETLEDARVRFGQFDGSTHQHLMGWLSDILQQHYSSVVPEPPHFAHQYDATLEKIDGRDTHVLPGGAEAFASAETLSIQSAQAPSPFEETLHMKERSGAGESGESEEDVDGRAKPRPESAPTHFGKYELTSMIAKGGMGIVYKAQDTKLNRTVALKMILSGSFAGEGEIARFYAEAEAAAKLRHANIVAIHEFGEVDGQHFFSMDYIEGGGLADVVRENALPADEAAALVKTVAEAMQYAHEKGILHRDLKPSNVLLDQTGAPMITDFGLAKQVEGHSGLTVSGTILGTPSYMPPEQAAGRVDEVTVPSDVYSIGAILYELLTGRPPFRAANAVETLKQVLEKEPVAPRMLNPSIPVDIETICLKCLQKERAARYATAQELTEELDRFLAGEPILARPIGRVARLWRWCRRKPKVAALAGIALLGTFVAVAAITVGYFVTSSALTRAEMSLEQLRGAIDELYVFVDDNEILNTPGLQPTRMKLLERAGELYKRILEQQGDHPEIRQDLALSYFRLGRIMQDLERPQEALAPLHKARSMQETLLEQSSTEEGLTNLGDILNAIGELLEKADRTDDALAMYDEAIKVRESLVQRAPREVEHSRKLINAYMNTSLIERAIAERLDDPEARKDRYQNVLVRLEKAQQQRLAMVDESPSDQELRLDLAKGYLNIGNVAFETERDNVALENLNEAIVQFDILLKDDPNSLENQYLRALCDVLIGNEYAYSEKPETAQAHYTSAIERLASLARENPEVHKYQGALGDAHLSQGILYGNLQQDAQALESCRIALGILKPLVEKHPLPDYQYLLDSTVAAISDLEGK